MAVVLLFILGLGAVGGWLYLQAGAKTPVVAVARDVAAGHVIAREDLTVIDVAGDVRAIAGDGIDSVVGEIAGTHLLPGMLLQRAMVQSDAAMIPEGMVRVGMSLKPGQLPAAGLQPGDTVTVYGLPAGDTTGGEAKAVTLAQGVQVFDVAVDPSGSGGFLLTVTAPESAAAAIASAANAGRVAVVQQRPPR